MCSLPEVLPEVISDALKKLELIDRPPLSWRLCDNKGNITVVLHWDHRNKQQQSQTRRAIASTTTSNLFIEKYGGASSLNSSRPNSGLDPDQWNFDLLPNKMSGNKKSQDGNVFKSSYITTTTTTATATKPRLPNGLPIQQPLGQPQLNVTPAISLPEILNVFDDDEEDLSEEIINSTLIKELISPSQEFAKCKFFENFLSKISFY